MVRAGSKILRAGIVADSSPRKAQSVSDTVAVAAEKALWPLGLKGTKWAESKRAHPKRASATNGKILRRVVMSCTTPAERIPMAFTAVSSQIVASAARAAWTGWVARAGKKIVR